MDRGDGGLRRWNSGGQEQGTKVVRESMIKWTSALRCERKGVRM